LPQLEKKDTDFKREKPKLLYNTEWNEKRECETSFVTPVSILVHDRKLLFQQEKNVKQNKNSINYISLVSNIKRETLIKKIYEKK